MRIWGRIADGMICELIETDHSIEGLFHPDLHWVDVTEVADVAVGWLWDGARAVAYAPPFEPDDAALLHG